MIQAKDHQNKPIISITDGRKLGEVKDLYLDKDASKMAAVHLGKEGILRRKTLALARASVQVYGIDAWLISGSDKVVDLEDLPQSEAFLLASEFRGREIITEGGTRLGSVEDVILDEEARVQGFSLAKVFVEGPLAERKAIARAAITDLGGKDHPMTTILARAEEAELITG
jgi:sporulation protein YlmC with PRC-barrel domain